MFRTVVKLLLIAVFMFLYVKIFELALWRFISLFVASGFGILIWSFIALFASLILAIITADKAIDALRSYL